MPTKKEENKTTTETEEVEVQVEEENTEEAQEELALDSKTPEEKPEEKSEEELQEYSEGVQKRIGKLTAKLREAERREKAALDYATSVKNDLANTQQARTQIDDSYVNEFSNRVEVQQKHLEKERNSRLDGVPIILPSIIFSQRIQEKASHAGFDWEGIDEVWGKLDEEINELRFAQKENDINKIREEIGDLLFTVINLSRFFGISAENALRGSNNKFVKRFQLLEKKIFDMNKNINDFSSNELDELWKEAKKY